MIRRTPHFRPGTSSACNWLGPKDRRTRHHGQRHMETPHQQSKTWPHPNDRSKRHHLNLSKERRPDRVESCTAETSFISSCLCGSPTCFQIGCPLAQVLSECFRLSHADGSPSVNDLALLWQPNRPEHKQVNARQQIPRQFRKARSGGMTSVAKISRSGMGTPIIK